jgi:hypothetical protein
MINKSNNSTNNHQNEIGLIIIVVNVLINIVVELNCGERDKTIKVIKHKRCFSPRKKHLMILLKNFFRSSLFLREIISLIKLFLVDI